MEPPFAQNDGWNLFRVPVHTLCAKRLPAALSISQTLHFVDGPAEGDRAEETSERPLLVASGGAGAHQTP